MLAARSPIPRSFRWLADLALVAILLPFALACILVATVPLLLVTIVSRLRISPAVRATAVPGVALITFVAEWVLLALQAGRMGGWALGSAMLLLFPFFVGALFVVAELVVLLLRRWRTRRRPTPSELPRLVELRGGLADRAWGVL